MTLKLHNTRTRKKEVFEPIDAKNVRMYVCGPTVYDFAHIGNARPLIVFDVLFRLLRHLYGPEHVTYVRNITDVDDKINERAAEEGISIGELTARTTAQFHADVAALGCLPPTHEPRATEHIPEMIAIIGTLIERGHAYAAEGHVLFAVASDPNYGKLAKRSLDEMKAGARVEVAPYKRDPMDFVLWKPSRTMAQGAGIDEPGWDSPWGFGRPGWHLECSAMSDKWLWQDPLGRGTLSEAGKVKPHVFDIHGGGIDLVFPHHENEVAQSTCCFGTDVMANVWMHNGHLQVEGAKMSKSDGNFITIHELLTGLQGSGWTSAELRLSMLKTHYRQPIDWTLKSLSESQATLAVWRKLLETAVPSSANETVINALGDDLNTAKAMAELHRLANQAVGRPSPVEAANELAATLNLLGFEDFVREATVLAGNYIQDLKRDIEAAGVGVETEFVENRICERLAARKAKNWAEADRIRDELAAMGIALKDTKDPETGEIVTTWEIAR